MTVAIQKVERHLNTNQSNRKIVAIVVVKKAVKILVQQIVVMWRGYYK